MPLAPHHRTLLELTSLPTAAGCEQHVIRWIRDWARRRRHVTIDSDRFGNLTLRSRRAKPDAKSPPIYFTAHLDHPAFVVSEIRNDHEIVAEFRGGVDAGYFTDARVVLHRVQNEKLEKRESGKSNAMTGVITALTPPTPGLSLDKAATIRFPRPHHAAVGDILTWRLSPTTIRGDRVKAPACDDLAGVAAALEAFDQIHREPGRIRPDVRLLLTRCEEVGFVGAIGACKAKTIPRHALVIALENSKSFAESPIGDGPIVRVGDRTSTFDPDLTYRISRVAERLAKEAPGFRWQRKLMPGGTCEASAYQSFGHIATCLCLPLGNYHNMNEATKRIDHEIISLRDYDHLITLLIALGRSLHDPALAPPLKPRLEALFKSRRRLVCGAEA